MKPTFIHPVHGECQVVDKREITPTTRSVLCRRVKDSAHLYLSTSYLPKPEPEPAEQTETAQANA